MTPGGLAFGVLGALEAYRDAAPVPLPSRRQRAVLAALLVRAGRPVRADALIDAAWGEALPADPRSALHTLLSRLRRALGVDVIRGGPAGYRLAVDADGIDAGRFEALRARAATAPVRDALRLLDAALALWRGSAYLEFADRDFARAEAVRLDELRLAVTEDRARLQLDVGDAEAAVALLAPLVGEHPLRERARSLLMTALYRAGRVSEALDRYQDYRRQLADELGLDPSPALQDLQARILNHELPGAAPRPLAPARPAPSWLRTDTAFVGRDDEAAQLVAAAADHRLVTVTGVGGVGKTRLVAQVLPRLAERLGSPVTVVELAAVGAEEVDVAVASGLALGPVRDRVDEAVLEYLSVTPMLLVLDNCEHVLHRVGALAAAILRGCPGVRIVATSRRRLGLPAEQVLPLQPLPAPAPDADLTAAEPGDAMRLFADRARRVRPSFALTSTTVAAAAELCRRLDGLPLAIELAAVRAATLGIESLGSRLQQSLDVLDSGDPRRHQSLRTTLDWSYGLLDADERLLLAALAVFEGDFDLDGAEHLARGLCRRPVAVVLAELIDASLVADRHGRYRLLETVRSYAGERLVQADAQHDVRLAFVQWALSVARGAAADSVGPRGSDAGSSGSTPRP